MALNVLDARQVGRAITRLSHEIVERNGGAEGIALVGVLRAGVPVARRIAKEIGRIEGSEPPVGVLDVTLYRDDAGKMGSAVHVAPTDLPFDVEGMTVVLVDDVLYTGRTIRCALDALVDFGRPAAVQLAVLVDRGHRELPIRADYVGKNVPTSRTQQVTVEIIDDVEIGGVFVEEVPDGTGR